MSLSYALGFYVFHIHVSGSIGHLIESTPYPAGKRVERLLIARGEYATEL